MTATTTATALTPALRELVASLRLEMVLTTDAAALAALGDALRRMVAETAEQYDCVTRAR
jgi:hypothetical protein